MALPYLDAVLRETLRVHPPVPSTLRFAMKDDVLPVEKPYTDRYGVVRDTITYVVPPLCMHDAHNNEPPRKGLPRATRSSFPFWRSTGLKSCGDPMLANSSALSMSFPPPSTLVTDVPQTRTVDQRPRNCLPSSRCLGSLVDLYRWPKSVYRVSVLARRVRHVFFLRRCWTEKNAGPRRSCFPSSARSSLSLRYLRVKSGAGRRLCSVLFCGAILPTSLSSRYWSGHTRERKDRRLTLLRLVK